MLWGSLSKSGDRETGRKKEKQAGEAIKYCKKNQNDSYTYEQVQTIWSEDAEKKKMNRGRETARCFNTNMKVCVAIKHDSFIKI